MSSSVESNQSSISLPSELTLSQATKLAIKTSLPICFYFYIDSCKGKVTIAKNSSDKKIIFKNLDEHTSPISNIYKEGSEYIIVTRNTIYIISSNCKVSKMPEEIDLELEDPE